MDDKQDSDQTADVTPLPFYKQHKLILITFGIPAAIILISGISLGIYTRDRGICIKGIMIASTDISNLTKPEAQKKIGLETKTLLAQTVTLQLGETTLLLTLDQLGLSLTTNEAIEQAYKLGREGNIFKKASTKARSAVYGVNLSLTKSWDDLNLKDILKTKLTPYEKAPVDATYSFSEDNQMEIHTEKKGRAIDLDSVIAQIKTLDIFKPNPVLVSFKEISPTISTAELEKQKITGLLATYTTDFNTSQANRTENIYLATQALNGKILKPGETFSFNDSVGPRTSSAGYKEAPIIVNGEISSGLGGGVCQVSTTLFNVLLLADLPISERTNHDLAVAYVPRGQDATVDYGNLDLKFRNNTGGFILIKCKTVQNSLTFSLYGQVKNNQEVTISTSNDPLNPNVIFTWRTVKLNGDLSKREKIASSYYRN